MIYLLDKSGIFICYCIMYQGTSEIEGVVLMDHDCLIEWKHFEPMHNLNFLVIYQHYEDLNSRKHRNLKRNFLLPRKLRLLHWNAYPFTTLPYIISPDCLVEVNLCYSKLRTLWSGTLVCFISKLMPV